MKRIPAKNTGVPEGDIVAMLSREEDVVEMYLSHVMVTDFEEEGFSRNINNPAETPANTRAKLAACLRSPVNATADLDDDDLEDDDLDLDDDDLDDDELDDVVLDEDLDDDDLDLDEEDDDDDEDEVI